MTIPVATAFATIFRTGEGPMVLALAAAIARHHPRSSLHVLGLDGPIGADAPDNVTAVAPGDLRIPDARLSVLRLATRADDARMATAPGLVAHILAGSTADQVIYLSPDTVLRAPLPPLPTSGITMTPRFTSIPQDDGRTPEPAALLRLSMLDDGFLAASRDATDALAAAGGDVGDAVLAADGSLGRAWDLLGACLPTTMLDDPSLGVAYWNAANRRGPITTIRLPGLDPTTPHLLSRDQGLRPRVLLSERDDLRMIVGERLATLAALGAPSVPVQPRIGDLLIDDAVRTACRHALQANPDFAAELLAMAGDATGETLAAWLGATVPGSREPRISRYLLGVWGADAYAFAAFPNPTDDQSEHLIRWARESSTTLGIPARFLPRPTDVAVQRESHPAPSAEALLPGVNLIGFLRAGFGVGEATRLLHEALIEGDIPHSAISVSHDDLDDKVESTADGQALLYDVNLICVNVDWLDMLSRRLGSDLLAERYFIGTWWWESNVLPPDLVAQIDYFDELWAGSTYVANALSAYTDHPIRVFPLPVRIPDEQGAPDRTMLGLPEGYLFMFSFDFNSTVQRKNPEAVIEAFRRAFPTPSGPRLVLKTINGHRHLGDLERLRAMIADRDDITIFDGFLPTEDRDAWTRATDCYVSLHRSEGFGLTMAEAMALGKPVIATAYSANLDFMNDDVAYLVPAGEWTLTAPSGPYPAGTRWAEPDIAVAADFMRRAAGDPVAAAAMGAKARTYIAETRTAARLADFVSNRLEEIRMEDRELQPRPNARLTARLNDALSYDRQRQGMRHGAVGRLVKKVIRPYSASADELDRRMLAAMVELGERLDQLDRSVDGAEQTVEALEAVVREERQRNPAA